MLSVSDAAAKLGVSRQRVRALLASGQLEGEKFGRAWVVDETSLARWMGESHHPGRPKKVPEEAPVPSMPNVEEAHRLYDSCKRALTGCFSSEFLNQARSAEEERFWVSVATFFLQQKQRELIEKGVY